MRIGLKQEKIYCVPEFNQWKLLKPYSEFNTNKEWKQKKIKTKVEKYAINRKTMKNLEIELMSDSQTAK